MINDMKKRMFQFDLFPFSVLSIITELFFPLQRKEARSLSRKYPPSNVIMVTNEDWLVEHFFPFSLFIQILQGVFNSGAALLEFLRPLTITRRSHFTF